MIAKCCKCGRLKINDWWLILTDIEGEFQQTYCPTCKKKVIEDAREVLKKQKNEACGVY